jgi:uncharacterized membrane protein HdeD (DUF308 family)
MLLAVLEKASGIVFVALVLMHRSPPSMLIGLVDILLGILFLISYVRTGSASTQSVVAQNASA